MWHAACICCLLIIVACLALSRYHFWTVVFRRFPTLFGSVAPTNAHFVCQPIVQLLLARGRVRSSLPRKLLR